jgi:hypothetical protein
LGENAAEAGEGALDGDVPQQGGERFRFLAEQQGQQDELKVPALRLAEAGTKRGGAVAQSRIHTYTRYSHSAPS